MKKNILALVAGAALAGAAPPATTCRAEAGSSSAVAAAGGAPTAPPSLKPAPRKRFPYSAARISASEPVNARGIGEYMGMDGGTNGLLIGLLFLTAFMALGAYGGVMLGAGLAAKIVLGYAGATVAGLAAYALLD